MSTEIMVRPAIDEDDRRRLREFTGATLGARGLLVLDTHLARARYCTDFTLMAESDGVLIGSALLRHLRLHMGVALIEAAEIEHLIIHQTEDSSLLLALVDAMLEVCAAQGLVLLLLHASAQPYSALGFTPYSADARLWLEAHAPATQCIDHRVEFALRPLNERLDGPADLGPLYEASYAKLPLVEERQRTDWRGWPGVGLQALVLEDRYEASIGYAVLDSHTAAGLQIYEAAIAEPGYTEVMLKLLCEYAHTRSLPGVILHLPEAHPLVCAGKQLDAARVVHTAATDEQPLALCGIVDLAEFLQQLVPELERRLHGSSYASWRGRLALRLEDDGATLHIEAAHITIDTPHKTATWTIRVLSLSALTKLLLGSGGAQKLRQAGELRYTNSCEGLLDVLFPHQALQSE